MNGLIAYEALQQIKQRIPHDAALRDDARRPCRRSRLCAAAEAHPARHRECHAGTRSTRAAASTIPNVPVLFWSFRFMVGFGFWFIALFAVAFWLSAKRRLDRYRWFLWAALLSLPLPWLAAELGWIVAEYGRQPWVIEGVLPTALGVSSTDGRQCAVQPARLRVCSIRRCSWSISICCAKYIRLGPDEALATPSALG